MEISDYQNLALKTINPSLSKKEALINAMMGLAGETGEVNDLVKKHLFHGHELKKDEIVKELGDVAWYLVEACYALDLKLEDVLKENINKLQKRYPDGFSKEKSINRENG